MKKIFVIVLFLAVLIAVPSSLAAENTMAQSPSIDEIASSLKISSNVSIQKFSDGRVVPVKDSSRLSDKELDLILSEMNVNDNELDKMDTALKKHIVSIGGLKVDMTTSQKQYYNSLSGEKYLITEENKDEVNKIKLQDMAVLNANQVTDNTTFVTAASCTDGCLDDKLDGIWSASVYMFYTGKTSNNKEFKYELITMYYWYDDPYWNYSDVILHSWSPGFVRTGSTGVNNYQIASGTPYYQNNFSFSNSIGGSKGTFDLKDADLNYGHMVNTLVIPVSGNAGTTKEILSTYLHPHTNAFINVILNFLSIDVSSFDGDEWELSGSFVLPNS